MLIIIYIEILFHNISYFYIFILYTIYLLTINDDIVWSLSILFTPRSMTPWSYNIYFALIRK